MVIIRDKKFFACLGAAATVHMVVMVLPWPAPVVSSDTVKQASRLISIRLTPAAQPPSYDEVTKTQQTLDPTPNQAINFREPSFFDDIGKSTVISSKSHKSVETNQKLNVQAITLKLREELNGQPLFQDDLYTRKTFSKADFVKPQRNQYDTKTSLPSVLQQSAFARSSRSSSGQSTDLIRKANGESMCWQQRGIPGETQQWYRVPLSLCGHLAAP